MPVAGSMETGGFRLVCNECGCEAEGNEHDLVEDGWHWSVFDTTTKHGQVGYAVCPDCSDDVEYGNVGEALYTSGENRQLAIVRRLANGLELEKILQSPEGQTAKQQTLASGGS